LIVSTLVGVTTLGVSAVSEMASADWFTVPGVGGGTVDVAVVGPVDGGGMLGGLVAAPAAVGPRTVPSNTAPPSTAPPSRVNARPAAQSAANR
jgi:hypothetical protein